jgi:hypothetical protein
VKPESMLRWAARAWSIASTLLLLAFAFGGREHLRLTAAEAIVFLLFPVGVVAGFAIAWWRELAGGLVTVGSLALFYLLLFARNGWVPVTPYFLLFAAPGFLHVACALIAARRSRDEAAADGRASPGNQFAEQPSQM